MSNKRQLSRELGKVGAKAPEIEELGRVAARLSLLTPRSSANYSRWRQVLTPAVLAFSGLVVGVVIVMLAQAAAPTSWLYPVQELSDKVAIKVHPDYRATVMMHRAEQVNQLVASHASSSVILATLNSYQVEAADYKNMSHTSYAAFEYCKSNLDQAAAAAPAPVRLAILKSLSSLGNT